MERASRSYRSSTHRIETTVPEWTAGVTVVGAVAALVMAYLGDGAWLTWAGLLTHLVALYGVIWICDRATIRQRQRVRRERGET